MYNGNEALKRSLVELEKVKERIERVVVRLDVQNHDDEREFSIDTEVSERAEVLERVVASITEAIDMIEDVY